MKPVHILIAPDKFKGSLTAQEVCEAISEGIKKVNNNYKVTKTPLADGGEGTLSILSANMSLQKVVVNVQDPLFRPVNAEYLIGNGAAYIEMATASGLELLSPSERNCLYTTTYGTGQLIKDALGKGVKEVYLFVGGSATNDAGTGMANALGYTFVGHSKKPLKPIGENLEKIRDFYLENPAKDWHNISFYVVCDVKNKLHGREGAARVYAEQKGADKAAIEILDRGLVNIGNLMKEKFKRNIADEKGSGAAGGLGAGAMAFLGATVKSGIKTVMEIVGLEKSIRNADLVITGEGKFDRQTLEGKVIAGVTELSIKYDKPVGVLCGVRDEAVTGEDLEKLGISKLLTLKRDDTSIDFAINNAYKLLVERSSELMINHFETSRQ